MPITYTPCICPQADQFVAKILFDDPDDISPITSPYLVSGTPGDWLAARSELIRQMRRNLASLAEGDTIHISGQVHTSLEAALAAAETKTPRCDAKDCPQPPPLK